MVKDFLEYIPLVSILIVIIYFLYSFSLKEILRATNSEINNSSNKSLAIMLLVVYAICFILFYYLFNSLKIKGDMPIIGLFDPFGFILPFIGFYVMKNFYDKKLKQIFLKEEYVASNKKYHLFLAISVGTIAVFSIIHALNLSLVMSNSEILKTNHIDMNIIFYVLIFFLKLCILFLTSGYFFSYGVLHKLTKFKFYHSNLSTLSTEAYLIGVNSEFYILKENNKKAISIKKDNIEKMEFL